MEYNLVILRLLLWSRWRFEMDIALVVTTVTAIMVALFGYIATYINDVRITQRTEQLNRVNKQLSEFYGPLFALSQANGIAWHKFREEYRPHEAFFSRSNPPSEEELQIWRLWIQTVFMPSNLQMYEIIVLKADLLIEKHMPQCLLLFCAHVTAYQPVLKKWELNDYSEHTSLINYPSNELLEYCNKSFERLKAEQSRLLGVRVS